MSDPYYDEDHIKELLSVSVRVDNLDAIQAGAVQTMCDLYDRGVTREEYSQSMAMCLALYGQCAKLYMLNSLHTTFSDNGLTEQAFQAIFDMLKQVIESQAEQVTGLVERLMQCPSSRDKVH